VQALSATFEMHRARAKKPGPARTTTVVKTSSSTDARAGAKEALLRAVEKAGRGPSTSSKQRAEITELLTELEAKSPTARPTDELAALSGKWKLVHTSNSELAAFFAAETLPLVDVGEIYQTVDASDGSVVNTVEISLANLASTSLSASACIEPVSSKRFAIEFQSGRLATPSLQDDVVQAIPDSLELFGQRVELSAVRDAVAPQLRAAIRSAQGLLSTQGEDFLQVPIPGSLRSQLGDLSRSWLLTTYLDADVRIARGDQGSVFILVRDDGETTSSEPASSSVVQAQASTMDVPKPSSQSSPPTQQQEEGNDASDRLDSSLS